MARKRNKMVFLPERTLLLIPGYAILVVGARDGYATLTVEKSSKKLRGTKYEIISIDEAPQATKKK